MGSPEWKSSGSESNPFEQARVGRFQIAIVILCGLITALDGFDAQAIGYVAPAINRDWHLHPGDLGPAISLGLLALMAGALFIAPLADRIGRRLVLIGSTVLFGIGTLATAWAWSLPSLMALRVVTGLGLGGSMPNTLALTSEFMPRRRRAFLLVMMFNGFNIGSMIGGILAAQFTRTVGWRAVFLSGGLLPILLAPGLLLLPESLSYLARRDTPRARRRLASLLKRVPLGSDAALEPVPDAPPANGTGVRALFTAQLARTTMLLWFIFFMSLLDIYLLVSWVPTALHVAGAAPTSAIIAGVLLQVGAIVASLPVGGFLDRWGPAATLAPTYLLGAVCIAAIGAFSADVSKTLLLAFGAGFCVLGGQAGVNAIATIAYPAPLRSTGTGWAVGIGRIGSIIGPAVGGALLNARVSVAYIFYLSAVPALLAALGLLALGGRPPGGRWVPPILRPR